MDWAFCLKYRQGYRLIALLPKLVFHGQDLVMDLTGPDNVANAEYLLKQAEAAGLIKRGKWHPTKEQLFFGVGGLGSPTKHNMQHRSAVEFYWETTT